MPDAPAAPVITFLSGYGLADEFVGVCPGTIMLRATLGPGVGAELRIRPE